MKRFVNVSFFTLVIWPAIFLSCRKDSSLDGPAPAPQQTLDTLSGREFEFNDLTWKGIPGWGTNVMVDIDRPDLFFNLARPMKVAIRLDTSFVWLNVFQDYGYYLAGINFYYSIGWTDFFNAVGGHLYIYPVPQYFLLNGRKASVKVKFL